MESDTSYGDCMVKLVWRLSQDNMENDTFYGDFMIKLVGRSSGNLIYHVSSIKTPDKLHKFCILSRDNIAFMVVTEPESQISFRYLLKERDQ